MIKCKLTEFLKSRNMTRYQLSKSTGISQNALSLLSNDKNKAISFDLLSKICTELDCQIGDILENVKDEKKA